MLDLFIDPLNEIYFQKALIGGSIVAVVAPKYGLFSRWMRLRNLISQQHIEDILTTILRNGKSANPDLIRRGNDAVDYLDEKLGNPTEDPHGKIIPQGN